ncbi:MAG: hypothetical protein Fur0022_00890 [Anaerolineales bacterium]
MPFQIATDDSSLLGWLTVAAYLTAAVLCGITALRVRHLFRDAYTRQHQLVWGLLTVAMVFLGFNKQLDLQTPFTHLLEVTYLGGRELHEVGESAQLGFNWFIGGLALFGVVASIGLLWYMRAVWRHYWLLALGVLFIARFVVVRAAGFYGVALPPLSQFTGGIQVNWLLEFLGALVIAAAAGIMLWRGEKSYRG